jgi:hypothetical protein
MQVFVTRKDEKTLEIATDHPEQITVTCLEIGGVLKVGLKLQVSDMEIGKTLMVDTSALATG